MSLEKSFENKKCWRIIPSRFPPIDLFERVAHPDDLESVFEIESLTNDRLREKVGNLNLVDPEDRVSGPGAGYVMAAFTHLNPDGSRFSDGTWGVYYAGLNLETALSETKYHREKFLRATHEDPLHLDMRVLTAQINGFLEDIVTKKSLYGDIYHPDDYGKSQKFARSLRDQGSNGIFYQSIRQDNGFCVAVFKPKVLKSCLQAEHLEYVWDGSKISAIFEKKLI